MTVVFALDLCSFRIFVELLPFKPLSGVCSRNFRRVTSLFSVVDIMPSYGYDHYLRCRKQTRYDKNSGFCRADGVLCAEL